MQRVRKTTKNLSQDSGNAVGFRTVYLRTAYLAHYSYIKLLVSLI
jgi:hypothetical protein